MVRLSFFLLLSILCFSCSNQIEIAEVRDGDGNLVEKYSKNKKTNLREGITTKYINNKIIEEAAYQNDLLHGERKLFHDNGKVQAIEHYEKGIFMGPYQSFYDTGVLKSEGNYIAGAMTGNWKFYYPSAAIKEIVAFVNNEENGPFEEYHENGKLKAQGSYATKEGSPNPNKEHGILQIFDESGTLIKKMNCTYGICTTTWTIENKNKE